MGDDLFSAWCEGTDEPLASVVSNDDGSFAMVRVPEQMFNKAVAGLAALETAALRAANEAHEKRAGRGRPKGTKVLSVGDILVLAARYRESTGVKPGAGSGPFVRFVFAFLVAIGRAIISEESVIDLVKDVRSRARTHPSGGGNFAVRRIAAGGFNPHLAPIIPSLMFLGVGAYSRRTTCMRRPCQTLNHCCRTISPKYKPRPN